MVFIPSLLYTPEQAAAHDRSQLSSLGASALVELDAVAVAAGSAPPGFFAGFEATLVGSGFAGTLSGPRELLAPSDVAALDATLEKLLAALRPHVLHRAGLKLLEFLVRGPARMPLPSFECSRAQRSNPHATLS